MHLCTFDIKVFQLRSWIVYIVYGEKRKLFNYNFILYILYIIIYNIYNITFLPQVPPEC